jgi:D-tagatose-1,6-bisphosphate aldolase subunit GatZ/KbaZ
MTRFAGTRILTEIVQRQKAGEAVGLASICSANRFVIEAGLKQAAIHKTPMLVEATCNQVNQFGGYTGSTPKQFASSVAKLAEETGCPPGLVTLGGDHLGPFPWRDEPAAEAMCKAVEMVQAYARAGFGKLHLDASMACADDDPTQPLPADEIARRAAVLCEAAETERRTDPTLSEPAYVIGTEVPAPGGTADDGSPPRVTEPGDVAANIEAFQAAFTRCGLTNAWEAVRAVVVQPGVEFGDQHVFEYDPVAAAALAGFIRGNPNLVYEAHSTDYQPAQALKAMVADQFAILKVGPALTFAFREAVFALERIEQEWLGPRHNIQLSGLGKALEAAMINNPRHWRDYYLGSPEEIARARVHSRLDRVRYYWDVADVQRALGRLFANLEQHPAPEKLLNDLLPAQHRRVRDGSLPNQPHALAVDHIMDVLESYQEACGAVTSS